MPDTPKARGDTGETIAARYLSERGYAILSRQWRCRYGELDLTARDPSGVICFVEVKLRKRNALMSGREAVDARKRERLRKAAACWLSEHNLDAPARFDVAEIRADPDGLFRLDYLPDAFT
ncbi:MAG: YraN family protein [Oscillibacter sp.]|nr:YraN family protein [Oscillibacter sp.]